MLAFLRPDEWDFPLFLHVFGAIVLFGGVAAVALLTFASLRRSVPTSTLLRRLAFTTTLLVVWPAYILMRIGAQWVLSKEYPSNEPDWVGVGYAVADGGILVLALLTLFTWLAARQTTAERPRPGTTTVAAGLTLIYVVALAVAWFAMTAKPG